MGKKKRKKKRARSASLRPLIREQLRSGVKIEVEEGASPALMQSFTATIYTNGVPIGPFPGKSFEQAWTRALKHASAIGLCKLRYGKSDVKGRYQRR